MSLEKGLLDKILNKVVLGKRQLGRPLKYNISNKHGRGVLEMMYKPRNKVEKVFGNLIHGFLPVLSYFTYRFHVERARVAGFKVEDSYDQKFFREPYSMWHVYAQNFHPWTLNERVRNVVFYRKTKTLFKGFKVPDWAFDNRRDGIDVDIYSREAWEKAHWEFNSEWTPMPYVGDRMDPNVLNWFRLEQIGKGFSSRYFFNEVPKPSWHRHGGHLYEEEKALYSFKYGDQMYQDVLGFDVSTDEGRKALLAEIERWWEIAPEIAESYKMTNIKPDQLTTRKYVSTEPHFQRALTHYRVFIIEQMINEAIENETLDIGDAEAAKQFFDEKGMPSASLLSMANKGLLGEEDSFESYKKVLEAIGLGEFKFDPKTPRSLEDQLVRYFDVVNGIDQSDFIQCLPLIVTDPRERSKVLELLSSGEKVETEEETIKLA